MSQGVYEDLVSVCVLKGTHQMKTVALNRALLRMDVGFCVEVVGQPSFTVAHILKHNRSLLGRAWV